MPQSVKDLPSASANHIVPTATESVHRKHHEQKSGDDGDLEHADIPSRLSVARPFPGGRPGRALGNFNDL